MKKLKRWLVPKGFKALEWLISGCSSVGKGPFFHPDQFQWIPHLESNWTLIQKELKTILIHRDKVPAFHQVSPEQYGITQDDKWKTYFFYAYGHRVEENCRACPETTRLIELIPGMTTAFFSILAGQKKIPEHRGLYNGVLRYHLGLMVPEDRQACGIRVGGDTAHWEEGKSVVFDDTYPHEAWNDTDYDRVVLFVDFLRPLIFPVSTLNRLWILSISQAHFIKNAIKNLEEWNRKTRMS